MELFKLFVSARSATLTLADGGLYATKKPYRLTLNGEDAGIADTVVTSLYGLWPDTKYTLRVWDGEKLAAKLSFHTREESCTLDVRRFGSVGDGAHDD